MTGIHLHVEIDIISQILSKVWGYSCVFIREEFNSFISLYLY